jgi:hypothetical protein
MQASGESPRAANSAVSSSKYMVLVGPCYGGNGGSGGGGGQPTLARSEWWTTDSTSYDD